MTAFDSRYWAFISYSHKDEKWARRLHHAIETYRGHKKLVGTEHRFNGPVPERLFPVFRDREELEGAAALPERIKEAIHESRFLIVICSPDAAKSKWVNEEIKAFKGLGREYRVLALIVGGEPNANDDDTNSAQECFPVALRHRIGPEGRLTNERTEPIAADARKGKDGNHNALLKIIAGVLGVRFDELKRRDEQRQAVKLRWIAGLSLTGVTIFATIAWYAYVMHHEAAERARMALSRQLATQSLGYLTCLRASLSAQMARRLLWDVMTGHFLGVPLAGNKGRILHIAFRQNGRTLTSAASDASVISWETSLPSWIKNACEIANRNLSRGEWEEIVGRGVDYHPACPELPVPGN
jgi:hypothetical protein